MIEVYPRLHVGNDQDWELSVKGQPKWAIVHACKEPYHRLALGYEGPAAPKDHPEYLWARRGDELCLNMIDARDPAYIPLEMVKSAINFVHAELRRGKRVLIHCNRGESRAPTLALLYMARHYDATFAQAEKSFAKKYGMYNPGPGCREFALQSWRHFKSLR